jgi:hypothetical protein
VAFWPKHEARTPLLHFNLPSTSISITSRSFVYILHIASRRVECVAELIVSRSPVHAITLYNPNAMTSSNNHTFFITGASSGLGLAIALEALRLGHKVIGTSRNIEKAQAQHPEFANTGGEWLQLDLTSPSVQEITKRKVEEANVDVLVNNAGYGIYGALEDMRSAIPCIAFINDSLAIASKKSVTRWKQISSAHSKSSRARFLTFEPPAKEPSSI